MFRHPAFFVAVFLAALLGLSACTVPGEITPGKRDSHADKATLVTESEHNHVFRTGSDQRVYITTLDGQSLRRYGMDSAFPEGMLLEPGKHVISVRYEHHGVFAEEDLWLIAERGKAYVIRRQVEGYAIKFWIEDSSSGQLVGGVVH
jgi:hypothetical protein